MFWDSCTGMNSHARKEPPWIETRVTSPVLKQIYICSSVCTLRRQCFPFLFFLSLGAVPVHVSVA